jgi:signal transduction histidine kinase
MPRTKLSVVLYVLLVFASGVLIGVASHRLYDSALTASANTNAPTNMTEFRKRYLAEMRERVKVSDQQIAAVIQHLDEAKRRFDDLRSQEQPMHDRIQQELVDQIRSELTDSQKAAYDKWHAERLALQAKTQAAAKK